MPIYSIDMSQAIKKVSSSIRSIFKPLSLFIVVISYLLIGQAVEYLYGPKVSQSLVLSGPFYLFLLTAVSLSLLLNLIRKLIRKEFSWPSLLVHIGLIGLFTVSSISNIEGPYKNIQASLKLKTGESTNEAKLEKFEISILNRNTKEKVFVDINYSLRPQGLNLDFGPTYLLTYLPFSQRTYNLRDAQGEVSAIIEVLDKKSRETKKHLLSTNNYDYENFFVSNNREIFLYNQEKLNCLLNLSNINPSCIVMLRRRSLNDLKNDLCKEGNYLITKSGFISLADSCRLNEVMDRLIIDDKIVSLVKYYTDKQLEEDYHYKRDLGLDRTDVIKYIEKQSPKHVRFIKPGQDQEIIDVAGDFHDMSFQYKSYKLPFSINLQELSGNKAKLKLNGKEYTLEKGDLVEILDYYIRLNNLDSKAREAKVSLFRDQLRSTKTTFFLIFCLGLILFTFSFTRERMTSK